MSRLDTFPLRDLIGHYRQVFSSPAGQEVLAHMLYDLGAFEGISDSPEDIALKNYGARLLSILGGGGVKKESIEEFTKRLMKQPLPRERKE